MTESPDVCIGPEFGFGPIGEVVLENAQPGIWPYLCGPSAASDLRRDPDAGLWVPPRTVTPFGNSVGENPTSVTLTLGSYVAADSTPPAYTVTNPSPCFPMQAIVNTEIILKFTFNSANVMIKALAWIGPTSVAAPAAASLPVMRTLHGMWTGAIGQDSMSINLIRRVGVPAGGSVTLTVQVWLYAQANPGSTGVTAPTLVALNNIFNGHGWALTNGQLPITDLGSFSEEIASSSGYTTTGTIAPSQAAALQSGQVAATYETSSGAIAALVGPAQPWTAVAIGGASKGEPSTCTTMGGTFHTFWQGTDNVLWHSFSSDYGVTWAAPAALAPIIGGPPQAVGFPTGVLQVTYTGTDGALWVVVYNPSTGWGAPVGLGGLLLPGTSPTAAVSIPGVTDILYVRTDNLIGHVFSSDYGATWSTRTIVSTYPVPGQLTATAHAHTLEIVNFFWRGSDGALMGGRKTNLTGWSAAGAVRLGGQMAAGTRPAPVTTAPDTVFVFWQGTDNNLWYVRSNDYGATFSAPIGLGSGPVGQPYVAAQSTGITDVFWRGQADGNVHHLRYSADGWGQVENLGGQGA